MFFQEEKYSLLFIQATITTATQPSRKQYLRSSVLLLEKKTGHVAVVNNTFTVEALLVCNICDSEVSKYDHSIKNQAHSQTIWSARYFCWQ